MRVYKASHRCMNLGTVISWHPNKKVANGYLQEAKKAREECEPENTDFEPAEVEPVDIPTNKAGLLQWLNTNFVTDNG